VSRPASPLRRPCAQRGAALVVVLGFLAASLALSASVATTASLELAMSEQGLSRLRAWSAAETGRAAVLEARQWSASENWRAGGNLADGSAWEAEVRLLAARVDPVSGSVEWLFEIESEGVMGVASVGVAQTFSVLGALPGEPLLRSWRQLEAAP
jgi:hypothetical protein